MTWDGERDYAAPTPAPIPDHSGNFNRGGPPTQVQSAREFDGGRAARAVYAYFKAYGPGSGADATRHLVPLGLCSGPSTVTGQIKWLIDHGWLRDTKLTKLDKKTNRNVRIVEAIV